MKHFALCLAVPALLLGIVPARSQTDFTVEPFPGGGGYSYHDNHGNTGMIWTPEPEGPGPADNSAADDAAEAGEDMAQYYKMLTEQEKLCHCTINVPPLIDDAHRQLMDRFLNEDHLKDDNK